MSRRTSHATVAAFLTLTVIACEPDDPCPEGLIEVRGECVGSDAGPDAEVANDDAAPADSDTSTDASLVTCEPTGNYDAFGKACQSQSDCSCPAGTCNTMNGVCTELNCMRPAPDGGMKQVCPPDWVCTDVSGLPPPDVNSICLAP